MNIISEKSSWNNRAKFLIVAYGALNETAELFAENMFTILKDYNEFIDVVLLIITVYTEENSSFPKNSNEINTVSQNVSMIYAFTLFPYLKGSCNHQFQLLIGKWYLDNNNDYSISGIEFFPSKIPKNFAGCTLKVGTIGLPPVVMKESWVTGNGGSGFVVTGTSLELIVLFANKLNFTLEFLEPISESELSEMFNVVSMLTNRHIHIMTGFIPVMQPLPTLLDFTFPFTIDTFKVVVPCPRAMAKVERITGLFTLSTWVVMLFVFILVSIVIWAMANIPLNNGIFKSLKNLSQSFSAAWAVLLGVSVPEMPVSSQMRLFFIVYVCYCFAISTVFQAYFTTYLVEPGYETRIKTYEDIKRAGLHLAAIPSFSDVLSYTGFSGLEHKFDNVKYNIFSDCVKRTMFHRDSFTVSATFFPSYLAHEAGIKDESKVVCFLDETGITLQIGAFLYKGSLLLGMLNAHILHSLEGGLLEIYWSRLKHTVNLRAENVEEDNEYVVFNVTHLTPVFFLLLFGYLVSGSVFVLEVLINIIKKKAHKHVTCHPVVRVVQY
ncbi:hypothetical protein L9F63_026502 [Diploptera punctata]|uniref:Ionotropic glutamate receptor C-terminal domain-containing protein n=1 Tax=Diploptera punctata TaxID=6984 RepID=A0AAD8AI92_DIPPU|nr:hypothetical protein L9F63_026502 [Diploptera punctata]